MANDNTLDKPYIYEYLFDNDNSYGFLTEQGVEYKISFRPTDYLFNDIPELASQTFEFIIAPVFIPIGKKPALDDRVAITIATIFREFYQQQPDFITLYICDSSDGKHRVRERLFNSWFEVFKGRHSFLKIQVAFDNQKQDNIDFSVIMRLDNPYKLQVMLSLEQLKNEYEQNK